MVNRGCETGEIGPMIVFREELGGLTKSQEVVGAPWPSMC